MKRFIGFILILVIIGFPPSLTSSEQEQDRQFLITGSSVRGEHLLFSKGCMDCHGITGEASDLGRTPRNASTPELLAGEMWNHLPKMWTKRAGGKETNLTSTEAADLFAFLYSTVYFAFPGSADRGRRLFEARNCAGCHSDQSSWAAVDDPLIWTERMWNHSSEMNDAIIRNGLRWPILSSQDIADLLIYLRSIPELRAKSNIFRMGEPAQGRFVFERSCRSCHSFGPSAGNTIDLLERPSPITVTGYIAAMWNHAPAMDAKNKGHFPALLPGEMGDLAAFLFSETNFLKAGNAVRGRLVLENKKCAVCHEQRRQETKAPNLNVTAEPYTAVSLIASAWRHGPGMSDMMRRNGISWPRFEGPDMADLIAYLNQKRTP